MALDMHLFLREEVPMKLLPILAGLALATPLYAQPYRPDYDRRTDESYRNRRTEEPYLRDRGQGYDVSGEIVANSTWQRVPIPEQSVQRLRFEGTRGRTYVGQIQVRYSDGRQETYRVGRNLNGPGDSFVIPLRSGPWRYVARIQVYTPYSRGAYRILAER